MKQIENEIFTKKELECLSCGIIALIRDASKANMLLQDIASREAIDVYIKNLQSLNTKICNMMT